MWFSGKWVRGFLVVLLAGVLSACGGGGSSDVGGGSSDVGGGSSGDDNRHVVPGEQRPAAPRVSLTIDAVKSFQFDWSDVTDATSYKLLENPDGMSGFTPVGDIEPGSETLELTVPLYARVNAQYILQACNAAGCSDSDTLSVSGNLVSGIGYFKASNKGAFDPGKNNLFGSAVSLSADGDTLAVGVIGEDSDATGVNGSEGNNSASNAGAVYVFARGVDGWSQQAYLKASNTDADDEFGWSISLSANGDTLAVGAPGEDSAEKGVSGSNQNDNSASSAGAVYVFTRLDGNWSQQAYLKASNTEAHDFFGGVVSLSASGYTLAVGAVGEDSAATGINGIQGDNSAASAGAVYVFVRKAGAWSQHEYLKASNAEAGDNFGGAISLNATGTMLAVGAIYEDSDATGVNGNEYDNSANRAGAVYVFAYDSSMWRQEAYLKASYADSHDLFGGAVSLSADGYTLAVGALGEDGAVAGVNGDQNNNWASIAGAVYVFARERGTWSWSLQSYLKASNAGAGQHFGKAVSLSADGLILAVGAHFESSAATGVNGPEYDYSTSYAGAVYVFAHDAGTWRQQAYLKASQADPYDHFGGAVSLSADGHTLAVGAAEEDSAATGVNGNQRDNSATDAGAVYLY